MSRQKTPDERRAEHEARQKYFRGFLERLGAVTSRGDALKLALMEVPSDGLGREYHVNLHSFLTTYAAPHDATLVELLAYSDLFDRISGHMSRDARENVQKQLAAEIARLKSLGGDYS